MNFGLTLNHFVLAAIAFDTCINRKKKKRKKNIHFQCYLQNKLMMINNSNNIILSDWIGLAVSFDSVFFFLFKNDLLFNIAIRMIRGRLPIKKCLHYDFVWYRSSSGPLPFFFLSISLDSFLGLFMRNEMFFFFLFDFGSQWKW